MFPYYILHFTIEVAIETANAAPAVECFKWNCDDMTMGLVEWFTGNSRKDKDLWEQMQGANNWFCQHLNDKMTEFYDEPSDDEDVNDNIGDAVW